MDLVAVEPQTNFNRATVKSCNLNSSIPPVVLPVRKHELKTKNADEAAHGRHEDGQKEEDSTNDECMQDRQLCRSGQTI